jgi:hypothetical protein
MGLTFITEKGISTDKDQLVIFYNLNTPKLPSSKDNRNLRAIVSGDNVWLPSCSHLDKLIIPVKDRVETTPSIDVGCWVPFLAVLILPALGDRPLVQWTQKRGSGFMHGIDPAGHTFILLPLT